MDKEKQEAQFLAFLFYQSSHTLNNTEMKKLHGLCMLMMVLSVLVLASCGDDDKKETTSRNVTFDYNVNLSPDILSLADVRVEYYDASGKIATETITESSWNKSLACSNPERFGYTVMMSPKSNISDLLTKDSYTFAYSYSINYGTSDGLADTNSSGGTNVITKSNALEYIQNHSTVVSIHYAVTSSGDSYEMYN